MARDETQRSRELLQAVVDVILDRGIADLSLSELARLVGSNNRMLLYYFGSKDELLTRAAHAAYDRFPELAGLIPSLQTDAPLPELLRAGWRRLRSPANRSYLPLFLEVLAITARDPHANRAQLGALVEHWPDGLRAAFAAHGWDEASARHATTQVLALWRGLQIELITGADPAHLDAVHDDTIGVLFARER